MDTHTDGQIASRNNRNYVVFLQLYSCLGRANRGMSRGLHECRLDQFSTSRSLKAVKSLSVDR